MKALGIAIQLLKKHEGLKLMPYKDTVGKLTIGYGRNLADKGITLDEAYSFLVADAREAEDRLVKKMSGFSELSENKKAALIDMSFNLGNKFFEFKQMIKALNEKDFEKAAYEMLNSKWAEQVGDRAKDLADIIKMK